MLVALFAFFSSCSRESPEPLWEPQSNLGSKTYNGGLFPVWITLKEPVSNISSIRWETRSARTAYRSQAIRTTDTKTLILADTAFLYWEEPPTPDYTIDSANGANDTTFFYRDTIFAIVDGLKSLPIVIEVKNILPRIKKFTVGGLDQFRDSILTIAVHPNEPNMEISIHLERTLNTKFNSKFRPEVTMPKEMEGLKPDQNKSNDSVWVYKWKVPDIPTDTTLSLKIEDTGGFGERLYKLRLIIYVELGSVWVASEKELVKFSSKGTEVARIEGFKSISDIVVYSKNNANYGKLFVADQEGNSISIYDTYGKLLDKDSTSFKSPMGVAVGVEGAGGYVWVADAIDETTRPPQIQLRGFKFSGANLGPEIANYPILGYIEGLFVDQFKSDFVWFTKPERDTVGYTVENEPEPRYIVLNGLTWDRPSMVNYDPKNKIAWIADNGADSGRVIAVDMNQNIYAIIRGFGHVSSISTCGGDIWVSDVKEGKVYRFIGPFKGTPTDLNYTKMDYTLSDERFISPVSVSALTDDCSVWVVDIQAGRAVWLDKDGKTKASGTGLTLPILGKAVLKVE